MPVFSRYATSGGSRLRAPTSAASSAATTPASSSIRNGIPQRFPDGDVSGVLRSPWASIQTTAEPVDSPRDARAPRRRACSSTRRGRSASRAGPRRSLGVCSSSVSHSTTPTSGYGRESARAPAILAARAPRSRHAHEPGGEGTPAAVALVAVPDRDRGEGPAVRTARAERAHETPSRRSSKRPTACIPTDS